MSGWVPKEIVDKIVTSYKENDGKDLLEDVTLFQLTEPYLWNGIYSLYLENKSEEFICGAIFGLICIASHRLKEYQDRMLEGIKLDEETKEKD